MNGIYQKRTSGAIGSANVVIKIKVENEIIANVWYDVPGGNYRGNDPAGYVGKNAKKIMAEKSAWKWRKVG